MDWGGPLTIRSRKTRKFKEWTQTQSRRVVVSETVPPSRLRTGSGPPPTALYRDLRSGDGIRSPRPAPPPPATLSHLGPFV